MWHAQAITELWNWLPAFRAVAETEHLPTASRLLHVSPSALSRTIRLLESEIGRPLFKREGKQLRLNAHGELFLAAVRDAMRHADEGVSQVLEHENLGPVSIAIAGPFAPIFVLPALARLRRDYPQLIPQLVSIGNTHARLLQGTIDVAIVEDAAESEQLVVEKLTDMPHGLFSAPGHPLVGRPALSAGDLSRFGFAAPLRDTEGRTPDRWPVHVPRNVSLRVSHMQVAIDAVKESELLAYLPILVGKHAGLEQLEIPVSSGSTLYALRRPMLSTGTKAELVLEAIKAELC